MTNENPTGATAWRGRIEASRQIRKEMLPIWRDSVSYRRGRPFKVMPTDNTVNIPEDWSRTKNKQAQLFYQVPEVKLKARRPEYVAATAVFAAALNFELTRKVKAEFMMNECLGDVINAAGIGICKVGYEATFEPVEMPLEGPPPEMGGEQALGGAPLQAPGPMPGTTDLMAGGPLGQAARPGVEAVAQPFGAPEQQPLGPGQMAIGTGPGAGTAPPSPPPPPGGMPPPPAGAPPVPAPEPPQPEAPPAELAPSAASTQTVQRPVYECYYARRISPAHFLWPVEWVGSDWNEAPWIGWEGYIPVAEAVRRGWVPPSFEGTALNDEEWFLIRENREQFKAAEGYVKFAEIFYKATNFDPKEKDPKKLKRIVIVEGLESDNSVAVDEDFQWQRYVPETRSWVGMTTYPIKVLTITNISDMSIPPSDSEIGRPQVKELIKGRSQMVKQRDHNLPLRWVDTNAVDDTIVDRLLKGTWQDMIPMNGPGDRAIGEVARAQYPRENFEFDQVAKSDLDQAWSMGAPQQGQQSQGDTTATEVKTMTTALNVRLDYERVWVLKFFLEVAEGVGNLMQLFSDQEDWVEVIGQDGAASLQSWNKDKIQGEYVFEAKPDSQLRLDVNQKRTEALNLYKLVRRDPLINPQGLVSELMELYGLDPTKVMAKPQPPAPEKPKISYTFKGEDLLNPYVVALQQKSGLQITIQDIQAAQKLIDSVVQPPQPPPQPGMPPAGAPPGGPPAPGGTSGPGVPPTGVPTGSNPQHPGPQEVVQPLNQRYNQKITSGMEGQR